jgi:hypothetical protein
MSTSGPRKAVVPSSDLPPFTVFKDGNFGYRVRYRIASEDRNRFSHYSPIYDITPGYIFERPGDAAESEIIVIGRGPYVNVIWEPVSIKDRETGSIVKKILEYDVWAKWDRGESTGLWFFEDTAQGKQEAFTVPSSYILEDSLGVQTVVSQPPTRISVEIYVRSTNPSRENTKLLVYKLDNTVF